jgi:hypothetical protein
MRRLLPIFVPLQSSTELEKLQAAFHWRGLPAIPPRTFMAIMALVSAPAISRAGPKAHRS